jgi:UDP-2,3-diacylglucosamine hydrolase
MHGNRDFLIGEHFVRSAGCRLLPDPFRLDADTLLAHGDALCVDDVDYQRHRREVRNPAWQQRVLAQSLAERRALAAGLRAESMQEMATKADHIMDVNAEEVARVMREAGARRLIHGHTHRPAVHRARWGTRYVLGAWDRCGWLLRDQDGQAALQCFPL